ncbi:MAG TPA: hypothetical protein VKS80_02330, partial [Trinickia sp.]|nr:hypothetical protein [Trinickia sp.]
ELNETTPKISFPLFVFSGAGPAINDPCRFLEIIPQSTSAAGNPHARSFFRDHYSRGFMTTIRGIKSGSRAP